MAVTRPVETETTIAAGVKEEALTAGRKQRSLTKMRVGEEGADMAEEEESGMGSAYTRQTDRKGVGGGGSEQLLSSDEQRRLESRLNCTLYCSLRNTCVLSFRVFFVVYLATM